MGGFVDVALSFPTVLFTFLLVVVIGYWALVFAGLLDVGDDTGSAGSTGALAAFGLGGPPASVIVSLLILFSWFLSLAGRVLLERLGFAATGFLLLLLAVVLPVAWLVTRLLIAPLRRLFPAGPEASRAAFVGMSCVIRTGQVTADFGQAEVTAADGSSAIVQVRQTGGDLLPAGSRALIYDYDAEGEFFWVTPLDVTFNPAPSPYRPT